MFILTEKSCCSDKHVEAAAVNAPIEVPRAYVAPPRDPEEITEPVAFISAAVVEAVVTDEGSLDYGGVDSDGWYCWTYLLLRLFIYLLT